MMLLQKLNNMMILKLIMMMKKVIKIKKVKISNNDVT